MLILLVIFYAFHLIFENYATYLKYGYAGIGMPLIGQTAQNTIALFSRGAVALFGLLAAYLVENGGVSVNDFGRALAFSYATAGFATLYFYLNKISNEAKIKSSGILKYILVGLLTSERNGVKNLKKIPLYFYPFVGIQFLALGLAYFFVVLFPIYRLTIIASVPLASMVGSLFSIVYVEAKFAIMIENGEIHVDAVLKEAMFQRICSLMMGFLIIIVLILWY